MISESIKKLVAGNDLTFEEASQVMDVIMSGQASDVQSAAYLTALECKGATIEEVTGSAAGMRAHAKRVLNEVDCLEIVGTGGDGSNTFNISTTSSLVAAAAGARVAKHGNRAASSKSGAADVLEALGANIALPPEKSAELLDSVGMCFLFAQNHHLAMKYVAPVRRELGFRTVFNLIGPLTNPAGANMELMGVYERELVEPLAQVMSNLGAKRGMVVYGTDGMDEISASAPTFCCELTSEGLSSYEIAPEDFGLTRCKKEDLIGGDPAQNADITRSILAGKKGGPRTAVLLNAGAALYVARLAPSIEEGVKLAAQTIDSGAAAAKLDEFILATGGVIA